MGRARVPGAPAGDHRRKRKAKRPPGLRVEERSGFWRIAGTMRAAGRSTRVRQGLGLAATAENWDAAEAERLRIEQDFRDTVIHGKSPSVPLVIAVDQYFEARPDLAGGDKGKLREVVAKYGTWLLPEVPWQKFIAERHAGNKRATVERYLNPIVAFLNWCTKEPRNWLAKVPAFERDQKARKPKHRRARRVAELTPALILFMAQQANPHMKGQIAAQWATGARVSSVLYGCRLCDYNAAPGREQITFHNTKTGEPVVAAVHPAAAQLIADYLKWRGNLHDREAPLFLSRARKPYKPHERSSGGRNRRGFATMKRRAIRAAGINAVREARELVARGDRQGAAAVIAEARRVRGLMRQVTQHWFRHALATRMMSEGGDLRSTMEQGGWLTAESVMGYTHDVPDHRREIVNRIGTSLTHAKTEGEKTA